MGWITEFLCSPPSAGRLRWRPLSSWFPPCWAVWLGHRLCQPALRPQLTFWVLAVTVSYASSLRGGRGKGAANISPMLPALSFFDLP